jgi:Mor family transcriptional regulator
MPRKRSRKPADQDPKRSKHSEILETILDLICAAFVEELKMDATAARLAAELAVEMFRSSGGGGAIYFAKGHLYAVTQNHRRIYSRFNGTNHFALAKEFNLSERQIYTIVERCQQEDFGRQQMGLFAEEA